MLSLTVAICASPPFVVCVHILLLILHYIVHLRHRTLVTVLEVCNVLTLCTVLLNYTYSHRRQKISSRYEDEEVGV